MYPGIVFLVSIYNPTKYTTELDYSDRWPREQGVDVNVYYRGDAGKLLRLDKSCTCLSRVDHSSMAMALLVALAVRFP